MAQYHDIFFQSNIFLYNGYDKVEVTHWWIFSNLANGRVELTPTQYSRSHENKGRANGRENVEAVVCDKHILVL